MTTSAPASARRAAIAFPIPRPPPVTRATLPVKSIVRAIVCPRQFPKQPEEPRKRAMSPFLEVLRIDCGRAQGEGGHDFVERGEAGVVGESAHSGRKSAGRSPQP